MPFETAETAISERYKRREIGVEEALVEMYLAGVGCPLGGFAGWKTLPRHCGGTVEALWGTRVSAGRVSDLNQKIYAKIEQWRKRPIVGRYAYVYRDGIRLKRRAPSGWRAAR